MGCSVSRHMLVGNGMFDGMLIYPGTCKRNATHAHVYTHTHIHKYTHIMEAAAIHWQHAHTGWCACVRQARLEQRCAPLPCSDTPHRPHRHFPDQLRRPGCRLKSPMVHTHMYMRACVHVCVCSCWFQRWMVNDTTSAASLSSASLGAKTKRLTRPSPHLAVFDAKHDVAGVASVLPYKRKAVAV